MTTTDSLEQLGAEIVARIAAAKKARGKAHDHEIAAGLRLIDAREQTGDETFPDFLQKFCSNLKKSRAYQLIAIAGGKTTVEAERTKTADRVRKHRAAKAAAPKAAPTEAAPTDSPLRNGQAAARPHRWRRTCGYSARCPTSSTPGFQRWTRRRWPKLRRWLRRGSLRACRRPHDQALRSLSVRRLRSQRRAPIASAEILFRPVPGVCRARENAR